MRVKERITTIRLMKKIIDNPRYSKELGLVVNNNQLFNQKNSKGEKHEKIN